MDIEKYILTYDKYAVMLNQLVNKIKGSSLYGELKFIYGPVRGGLGISLHLSHHLDLTWISTIDLNALSYEDKRSVLISDDIADTGRTISGLKNHHRVNFISAVLFIKDRSIVEPEYWIERNNNWVYFPWESLDEKPNRPGYNTPED